MATDHRGRELHAGKRTAQDSALSIEPAAGPELGYSWGFSLDSFSDNKPHQRARASLQEDALTEHLSGHDIEAQKFDLGRGKSATTLDIYDKEGYHQQAYLAFSGKARTRARAEVAARAMQKRIDERRDLKTGRITQTPVKPKRPSWKN